MARVARIAGLAFVPALLFAQQAQPFPHAKHERLFPTCLACHAGIPGSNAATEFPSPSACASCHDGKTQPRVSWVPPRPRGTDLLVFTHAAHFAKASDVQCAACHAMANDTAWMDVVRAAPERCVSCHAHEASAHLANDNKCSTCHRPLTSATGLSDTAVAAIPKPPSHAGADFLTVHGVAAQATGANCAVCHARESCAVCHLDAGRLPAIQALAADSRVARVVANERASYPTPPDHLVADFGLVHGKAATANVARCATCHARASCETCHIGDGATKVVSQLLDARAAGTRGVRLQRVAPPAGPPATADGRFLLASVAHSQNPDTTTHKVQVHPSGFVRAHGVAASSGELQCLSCHAQRFCTDCHVGEMARRRYHPANFVSTHPAKAYGRDTECSSCHNTETFCLSCHRQVGVAAKAGVRSTVFHNAQPFWLLEHGRAARQDLTNCTTCHQQTYCMQCHSDAGSRINPHGPDFNAALMAKRNSQMCLFCHLKSPLGGN